MKNVAYEASDRCRVNNRFANAPVGRRISKGAHPPEVREVVQSLSVGCPFTPASTRRALYPFDGRELGLFIRSGSPASARNDASAPNPINKLEDPFGLVAAFAIIVNEDMPPRPCLGTQRCYVLLRVRGIQANAA